MSVGKNNLYGHPDNQTITFFENIMGNFVERTDVKEESIKVSLSEDFFSNMYLDSNYLAERMQDNK